MWGNVNFMIRRLVGRPTGIIESGVKLKASARIVNIGGPDARIHVGQYSVICGELLVFAHGGEIRLGNWCFVGEGTRIWSGAKIHIGDRVLISHNVSIFDNLTHPLSAIQRHKHFVQIASKGHPRQLELGEDPVVIEEDAWIGAGAILLKGIRIGRGAVVGAGSVVTHDVLPWTLVAGNPARFIRNLPV